MTQEQIEQMEQNPLVVKESVEERTFTNIVQDFVKVAVSHKRTPEDTSQKIELRPYQADILKNLLELLKNKRVAALEAFCSAGKTILGFTIIAYYLVHNPGKHVLFISPNKTAFDHFEDDARKVLHNTWGFDCDFDVGGFFDYTKKIHIKTHFEVVREFRKNPQEFHAMMSNTSIIVVDEVHRYPEEAENRKQTVYIGQLPKIIKSCAKGYGVHLMMMTGTHFRMDGQNPFGVKKVDFRISMQELIRLGYIPELRGSVLIVGKLEEGLVMTVNGKDIQIKATDSRFLAALKRHPVRLAELFMEVQKKDPTASHVVFAYNCEVAEDVCREINKRLDWEGMVVMTSKSGTIASRKVLIDKLNAGKYIGFVTVDVGSESINIPRLKYCHMMAKTKSVPKIGQRSGRICRPFPGKEEVFCVDYQYLKENVIRCAKGLADLYEIGSDGTDPTKFKDIPLTAPLYTRNNAPRKIHKEMSEVVENNFKLVFSEDDFIQAVLAKKEAITHGDVEGWILREAHEKTATEIMTERLIARKEKPRYSSKDPEEDKDYNFWARYCSPNSREYDSEIEKKVLDAHQDWKIKSFVDFKSEMTERLIARKERPICSSKDPEEKKDYAFWIRFCNPKNKYYDPEIEKKVLDAHQDWGFKEVEYSKSEMIKLLIARKEKPRYSSKDPEEKKDYYFWARYCNPNSREYDSEIENKILDAHSDWKFKGNADFKSEMIERLIARKERPFSHSKDPEEKKDYNFWMKYGSSKSKMYDPEIEKKILDAHSDWKFRGSTNLKSEMTERLIARKEKPSGRSKDPEERKDRTFWSRFCSPNSREYDSEIENKVLDAHPDWKFRNPEEFKYEMTERLIARKEKPIFSSEDPEEMKDYRFWVKCCNPNSKEYDREIAQKVLDAHSDWKFRK